MQILPNAERRPAPGSADPLAERSTDRAEHDIDDQSV